MQGNSNRPFNNSESAESQNGPQLEAYNHFHFSPITAQPQQYSRTFNRITNCSQTSSRSGAARPFINYAAAYGQNIRPWLKMSYHSEQNARVNSSESVIINFDNISEPSTSQSVDLYEPCSRKTFPELLQDNVGAGKTAGPNDHQNFSQPLNETNINIFPHNNNNNNNNNNFGSHNISHSDGSSINPNVSVIQNNDGSFTENSSLNAGSGNQSLDKIFNNYIPLISFLSLTAIYDHRQGILIFVALLVTFIHANSVVKREIAKQSRRSFISLGIIFVNLFVSICFIYFVFRDQQLYKNLIFIPSHFQPLNIWDVFWIVGITDFVLKFITIQLKVGMACFPAKLLPYPARGKWYLMLERTSQLYRGLVPIQPWLYYLMEVYQGPESMIGMFFLAAYVFSKAPDVLSKAKLFLKAFMKVLHSASLGVHPSNEQLVSAGSQCPICHDEYDSPIILQCRHVFCESCVSTWFDREQTCPLCRAKIADDPSWRDGSTSLFTQLF